MLRVKGLSKKLRIKQAKPKPLKPFKAPGAFSLRKLVYVLTLVAAATVVGAGGGYVVRWSYDVLTHSDKFAIRKIEISGAQQIGSDEIIRRSGLKEGLNIFSVNLGDAVRGVEAHPWIAGVTIKRKYPDTILIHIQERNATAILRESGYMKLMDRDGLVFKTLEPGDPVDLPIINGPGGSDVVLSDGDKADVLSVIELASRSAVLPISSVSEIVVAPNGLELICVGDLYRVRLGDDDFQERWKVLEMTLTDARRSGADVIGVDLRYKNGAVLKLKSAPKTLLAEAQRASSANVTQ